MGSTLHCLALSWRARSCQLLDLVAQGVVGGYGGGTGGRNGAESFLVRPMESLVEDLFIECNASAFLFRDL